jgi:hypothetical protein
MDSFDIMIFNVIAWIIKICGYILFWPWFVMSHYGIHSIFIKGIVECVWLMLVAMLCAILDDRLD